MVARRDYKMRENQKKKKQKMEESPLVEGFLNHTESCLKNHQFNVLELTVQVATMLTIRRREM